MVAEGSFTGRRTGTEERIHGLHDHLLQAINALVGASDDHSVLARDLIARKRVIRGKGLGSRKDVEVRQRRLDHEDVGAFVDVTDL